MVAPSFGLLRRVEVVPSYAVVMRSRITFK